VKGYLSYGDPILAGGQLQALLKVFDDAKGYKEAGRKDKKLQSKKKSKKKKPSS